MPKIMQNILQKVMREITQEIFNRNYAELYLWECETEIEIAPLCWSVSEESRFMRAEFTLSFTNNVFSKGLLNLVKKILL